MDQRRVSLAQLQENGWRRGYSGQHLAATAAHNLHHASSRAAHRMRPQVRQTLGGPIGADKNFLVTSNARNEAMFREASEFSAHIRTLERDLQAMEKQVAGAYMRRAAAAVSPAKDRWGWHAWGACMMCQPACSIVQP